MTAHHYSPPHIESAPELHHVRRQRRRIQAGIRDTLVLLREFRGPLVLFVATLLMGGWAWMELSNLVKPEPAGYMASVYTILKLVFFQLDEPFPSEWYRALFIFLMPVLGLVILGRGAADFGIQLFNRRSRHAQWEVAVASTFRDHIVIGGLGHVGIRVVRELVALGEEKIVAIDCNIEDVRAKECKAFGIPVIEGDARHTETLIDAGIEHAESFITCTNDDLTNIQIALAVRELNPDIRLVVRMFNATLGRRLAEPLGFNNVFSSSALSAPFFAGAATGTAVTQTFYVEDKVMNMGRIWVHDTSDLCCMTVGDLERDIDLSVVLHQRGKMVDLHPNPEVKLEADDLIVVFANLGGLAEVRRRNHPRR